MDIHGYRRRLTNGSKNFFDNTKVFINENFTQSPFYQLIYLNDMEIGAIVNDEKSVTEKTILLRPNEKIDKGEVIEYDQQLWLVMDFNHDEMYPTLKVRFCNQKLKSITDGSEIPVVAIGKRTDFDEDEEYLIVTTNEITVYASYQQAKHIELAEKFTMNARPYEVIGIDDVTEVYENKGIIKFTFDKTEMPVIDPTSPTPTDPTENTDGGWGDW
jgi:hypothetical protein